jgi:hypothetical protein
MRRILLLASIVLLCIQAARSIAAAPPGQGSRTDHYITDAVLHRRWAVVADSTHPERPWTLEEVPWKNEPNKPARAKAGAFTGDMPLIPAGARVRLWRKGDGASIELTGTALESGMAGQTIHVRTGSRGTVLEGQVRGEDSVELSNSAKWQGKLSDGWSQ